MPDDPTIPNPEGIEPPAAPEPNPWDNWRQAGIDPNAYNPHEVQNAARFFEALKSPDQRQHALGFFASQLSPEEREILAGGQPNPYAQPEPEPDPYYGDPGPGDYGYEGQPSGLTPDQVQQMIQQQFSEFQRQQAEQQAQDRYQQEFERELMRATGDGYTDDERRYVAASALQLRQSEPYSTTGQIMDKARAQYDAAVERRLQQASQRQQQVNQDAAGMPPGEVPSPDQQPMSPEEARQMYLRMTNNQ